MRCKGRQEQICQHQEKARLHKEHIFHLFQDQNNQAVFHFALRDDQGHSQFYPQRPKALPIQMGKGIQGMDRKKQGEKEGHRCG